MPYQTYNKIKEMKKDMVDINKTIDTVVGGVVAVKVIDTSAKLLDTNPRRRSRRRKKTRRSKTRAWKI